MSAEWFAGRLRELRGAAGLTQEQLAERAGVKRDAVARWEAGTREPSWSNVVALVKALGVDANAFLQEPASAPPVGPGRPRKVADADADQHQKRPRGRARKAPGVARGEAAGREVTTKPSGEKDAATGQRRKRKGKER
jgi:transcriptional regulator with XRE-family HTH domain